jgi:DNA-binding transcriptional LysR family regulator
MLAAMRIPVPLTALHAFETVARLQSIKDAAEELSVTPSAISHRLRTLEDILGLALLRRTSTRIELTEAGRKLAPELQRGFAALRARRQATRDLLYLREEAPSHILNDVGLTREQIDRELHRLRRETFW